MARRSAGAAAEAQYRVSSRPRDSRDDQCLGVREEQTAARSISRVRRRCCEAKLAATVAAPVGGRRRRRRGGGDGDGDGDAAVVAAALRKTSNMRA